MSYIDTGNNSYVGTFLGIPVYHPLEILSGEFEAGPNNLVIGGGSGEHPGLVIQNLDACVWDFLDFLAKHAKKDPDKISWYKNWEEQIPYDQADVYSSYKNLKFHNWSMDDISNFTALANKEYEQSIQHSRNKDELENVSVENKITIMLGEFIYFSAKHLLSEDFKNYMSHNKKIFEKEDIPEVAIFTALEVAPQGYPITYGRYYVKEHNKDKAIKWGLRFEDEDSIDENLNNLYKKPKIKM